MTRYDRQMLAPQMGEKAQAALRSARLLVVGLGGLGCPALLYLAGAGAGRIVLVDADRVERSNLHRQPLYGESDIGRLKAEAARDRLRDLNPDVETVPVAEALDAANAPRLVADADVVLDCADSFAVTYTLSDTCKALGKPLISASALGLTGYVGGYCGTAPSVRAIFPDLPNNVTTCATAGVLGPLVGTLGALQAQMAVAVVTGMTPSPLGQLVTLDLEGYGFRSFRFDRAKEPEDGIFPFIARTELSPGDLLIELRDEREAPHSLRPDALRLTVADFQAGPVSLPDAKRVVLCCRSGLRAWRAAKALRPHRDGPLALLAAGDAA
ncbi:HesA/MoeB/ThiF family protein [Rhizobiaceae bacterium BDR2-2]|uniref:HesA/MoeB/ThiF family protein n=1 Tax=Ectorhizobium quercum TaxID=2965071 RepID=A0AAE3MXX0_9HYPH|nr:HesA/MoeB/ThiF family protein [Ectorhizobium quercum]MCX8997248.1 HesA/MoeB/ThiF family protein [Ectorhizobium quercum]